MPEAIAHYRILEELGSRPLGEAYRARDTRLGRTVTIEVVRPEIAGDGALRDRFVADARTAAAISHPNIAAVYEVLVEADRVCLVSEYVPGEPLRAVIGGRPLKARRAIELAAQVADGLAEAHAHHVAHGDIGSDTVVITPKGSAKLLHPGVSAWRDGGADLPPVARDLHQLGALLAEAVTGRPWSATPVAWDRASGVPADLAPVLAKALSTSAAERYGSAAHLAADLRAIGAMLDEREAHALPVPVAGRSRSKTALAWLIVVLVLAAIAALVWAAATV